MKSTIIRHLFPGMLVLLIPVILPGPLRVHAQNQASTIATSLPGEDDRQLESLVNHARRLEASGDFVGAQQVWNQIAAGLKQRFGENSWQAANANMESKTAGRQSTFNQQQRTMLLQLRQLQSEAATAAEQQNWDRVREIIQTASQQAAILFGDRSHETARIKTLMAQLAHASGDPQQAWDLYRDALSIMREVAGVDHPEVETLLYSIASLLQNNGQYEMAIPYLSQCVASSKRVFGDQSPIYADRLTAMGIALQQTGKSVEAIEWLTAGDAIQQATLGVEHPRRVRTLVDLGVACLSANQPEIALAHLTRAETILSMKLGDRDPQTLATRTHLATAQLANGQIEQAEASLRNVLAGLTESETTDGSAIARIQYKLAIVIGRNGELDESEQLLRSAVAFQQQQLGADDRETLSSVNALIALLDKADRPEEANRMRQQFQSVANAPGADSVDR